MKMYSGFRTYIIGLIVIVSFSLAGCPSPHTYKVEAVSDKLNKQPVNWSDSLENVKIFFEISLSMRGYVNLPSVSDSGYIIKRVVPYLITDCSEISPKQELWTISISPERYSRSLDEFTLNLRNGTLMQPGNSELHKVFEYIVTSNGPNELSFLVTDCIPDLSTSDDNRSLDEITTRIDQVLRSNHNLSAIVYQFKSEFNGDWYYDQTGGGRPYQGRRITLHDRPLYVWMFGREGILQAALDKGLFSDMQRYPVENSYSYGVMHQYDVPFQLFDYPMENPEARAYTIPEDSLIVITEDNIQIAPITILVGMNLSGLPYYARQKEYLQKHIAFSKEHLVQGNSIRIIERSEANALPFAQEYIMPELYDQTTHLLHITFGNLDVNQDLDFSLILNDAKPDWIQLTNLGSDLGVIPREIENKTFAFRYITDGFDQTFRKIQSGTLFELRFVKTTL